jgi:hypothetical protein
MNCYVCSHENTDRVAVGLCHHGPAGICTEHAIEMSSDVTTTYILNRNVMLPIKARRLLCHVCKNALEQPRERGV